MSPRVPLRRRPPGGVLHRADGSLLALGFPVRTWIIAALLVSAAGGVAAGVDLTDLDDGDAWEWAGGFSAAASRIQWGFVPLLAVLTTLYYLASALGVCAAADGVRAATDGVADRRLGLWEVTLVQFAGAAANRLAPGGIGSAAVTCRYLTRRGLPACAATATVATAGAARGVTKLGLLGLAVATWSCLGGSVGPAIRLDRVLARHSHLLVAVGIGLACALTAVVAAALCWRRGRRLLARLRTALSGMGGCLRNLLSRPRSLLTSLAASAGAHTALALAFAVSLMAVPGTRAGAFGPLLVVYLIGATAGSAVPTPAGVGSTEAALITALAAVHVPAAQAAQGVLLFRVMTFWAPVPMGIVSTRRLRRSAAL